VEYIVIDADLMQLGLGTRTAADPGIKGGSAQIKPFRTTVKVERPTSPLPILVETVC
jgi:hypothetical protein